MPRSTAGQPRGSEVNFRLFEDIHGLAGNRVLDAVMRFSAQYLLFAVLATLALLLLVRLRADGLRAAVRDSLWPAAGLVLSYALGLLAAAVHPEARPFTTHPQVHPLIAHHPGDSFPSAHSTAASAIALVVLAFLSQRPQHRRIRDRAGRAGVSLPARRRRPAGRCCPHRLLADLGRRPLPRRHPRVARGGRAGRRTCVSGPLPDRSAGTTTTHRHARQTLTVRACQRQGMGGVLRGYQPALPACSSGRRGRCERAG